MSTQKTNKQMEREVATIRKELAQLENQRFQMDMIKKETSAVFRLQAVVILLVIVIQVVFVASGRGSPFSGVFAWLIIGLVILLLFQFLLQLGIHTKQKMDLELKISEKEAQIKAILLGANEQESELNGKENSI